MKTIATWIWLAGLGACALGLEAPAEPSELTTELDGGRVTSVRDDRGDIRSTLYDDTGTARGTLWLAHDERIVRWSFGEGRRGEQPVESLPSLEETNRLLEVLWQQVGSLAPPAVTGDEVTPYVTCVRTVVCGYFRWNGMDCYACTGMDENCNTSTSFDCYGPRS